MAPIIFWVHKRGMGYHMDDRWLFHYEFLRTLRYTAICLVLMPRS